MEQRWNDVVNTVTNAITRYFTNNDITDEYTFTPSLDVYSPHKSVCVCQHSWAEAIHLNGSGGNECDLSVYFQWNRCLLRLTAMNMLLLISTRTHLFSIRNDFFFYFLIGNEHWRKILLDFTTKLSHGLRSKCHFSSLNDTLITKLSNENKNNKSKRPLKYR